MFAADAVAFGTWARAVAGLDNIVREQWENVWPRIRDFRFDADARVGCSGDSAWIATGWLTEATGPDGRAFTRPGRGTFVLERRGGRVARRAQPLLAPAVPVRVGARTPVRTTPPADERRPGAPGAAGRCRGAGRDGERPQRPRRGAWPPLHPERVRADGFGPEAAFTPLVAELDGAVAGYVFFVLGYNTDLAAKAMWLHDLFVVPSARGRGVGSALMAAVAGETVRPADHPRVGRAHGQRGRAEFYRRIGAEAADVRIMSLSGDRLRAVAATLPPA